MQRCTLTISCNFIIILKNLICEFKTSIFIAAGKVTKSIDNIEQKEGSVS